MDDDLGILETLVEIFQDMGYQPVTAPSATDAIRLLESEPFHVALIDLRLPDLPGTVVLSRARELQPDLKCIVATGNATLPSAVDAVNEGAVAYLLKPMEVPHVQAVVRQALREQRLELERRHLLHNLEALNAVTDSALASLELDQLLEVLLERFLTYIRADRAGFHFQDASGELRERRALARPAAGAAQKPDPIPDLLTRAVDTDSIVVAEADPDRGGLSVVAAPLWWRGRMLGAAYAARSGPFRTAELELMRLFAGRAGTLIGNAQLYQAEHTLRSNAEAYSQLTSALVEQMGVEERIDLMARHLMAVTRTSECLVFLCGRDGLAPVHHAGLPHGLRLPVEVPYRRCSPRLPGVLAAGAPHVWTDLEGLGLLPPAVLDRWQGSAPLLIPLRWEGRPMGLVALGEPGRTTWAEEQVRQARTVADTAATAIQQARTIQEERDMLTTLAQSFLSDPPSFPGLEIASLYEPATTAAQVGGDYYDFLPLGTDRLGVVIGDVCGKGRAAATYMAMAKYTLRAYAAEDPDPVRVLTRLNRTLCAQPSEECTFMTLLYGVLEGSTGRFLYCNAGHPPPILCEPEGPCRSLELAGPAAEGPCNGLLGLMERMTYRALETELPPASLLALYTDGVTEARRGPNLLGEDGVIEALCRFRHLPAAEVATSIHRHALDHAGGLLHDDVAIVVLRRG